MLCVCVYETIYMNAFSNFQNAWQLKSKTYEYNIAISFTGLRLLGLNAGFAI